MNTETVVFVRTLPCINCGERSTVAVSEDGYNKWQAGAYLQDAFPTMSAGDREMLKTGIHSECWDAMFPDEEEEE